MKSILKLAAITMSMSAALFVASCGNEAKHEENGDHEHADSTAHSGAHTYMCPMNCEDGKTYTEPGKCPKCGMNLEHNDNAGKGNGNTYVMQYVSNPAQLEAGKEALLSFTPKIKGKENDQVPLDIHHEKKIHLIIVSKDLSYFEHIHPEFNSNGNYDIKVLSSDKKFTNGRGHNETTFENGGEYIAFADYNPTGADHQLEKIEIKVDGKAKSPVTYKESNLKSTVDGYTVSLEAEGGKFATNQQMHIAGIIMQGGKEVPAEKFENYLGAKAHMVVVGLDKMDYLHVHPEVENGRLDLHTTFDSPGIYRGWLQFQTNGKVHTAQFTINVEEGKAVDGEKQNHSDEHKH
ncbi:MAG: hypothetical protein H0X46_00215 [Bacteroidetes bacterium]|nr:hypothetical protein [Bacteroidota bacterium]